MGEALDQLHAKNQQIKNSVAKYSNSALWGQFDVSDPELVFDLKTFLAWVDTALMPSYEGKGEQALFSMEDEIVAYMNRSTAMVQGSKTLVFSLTRCPIYKQNKWRHQDCQNFKLTYCAYKVHVPSMGKDKEGNPKIEFKEKNLADIWLNNPNRRIHYETTFNTDPELKDDRFLNLWMGYRYSMKAIDEAAQYRSARNAAIEFLKFVYEVHCGGSWTYFVYFISWMATKMRNPAIKMSTAIALFSKTQRVGKGFCWNTFGYLFGQHYGTTTNSDDIIGRWTAFKDNKALIFLDEVSGGVDSRGPNAPEPPTSNFAVMNGIGFKHLFVGAKTLYSFPRLLTWVCAVKDQELTHAWQITSCNVASRSYGANPHLFRLSSKATGAEVARSRPSSRNKINAARTSLRTPRCAFPPLLTSWPPTTLRASPRTPRMRVFGSSCRARSMPATPVTSPRWPIRFPPTMKRATVAWPGSCSRAGNSPQTLVPRKSCPRLLPMRSNAKSA